MTQPEPSPPQPQHAAPRGTPFQPLSQLIPQPLSRSRQVQILLAAVGVIAGSLAFFHPGLFITTSCLACGIDIIYERVLVRLYLVLATGIVTGWLLQPSALHLLAAARARLTPHSRRVTMAVAVAAACCFLSIFLITAGRHQFGAFDFSLLIETGWRQILGQRPFVDFVTPTPPFFNWATALAFRLFGVTWNANLYLSAVFSSLTLIWAFLLFRGLGMRSAAALGTSTVIQTAAMLTCCFWWYNNTTLILAALFYLSSLLLARLPASRFGAVSFVLLLGFLPLTKPNIAGLTLAGCLALLLLTSPRRGRVLLLALGGLLFSLGLLLAAHVSLPAMIATYVGVARERGGFNTFGFDEQSITEKWLTCLWMPVLCLPLLGILRFLRADLRARHWRQAVFWLSFPFSAFVAVYGTATNGELRDVECTLLIAALALLAFVFRTDSPRLARCTVALFCGLFASDLYTGIARLRVYTIGQHAFFEWEDNNHVFTAGFFAGLHASPAMAEVDDQLTQALRATASPVFLGPRLDFEYAVHRLPSPAHLPAFFQPGTAFDRARTAALVQVWRQQAFPTLIFLKDEYTFYPDALMDEIGNRYLRDDRYPRLSVYRRSPAP